MNAAALGPELAALQRARLHLRGGRRRLRQGKISYGIAALADALTNAMEWFCAAPARRARVPATPEELRSDRTLYAALVRGAVLDGTFDFDRFERLVDRALETELPAADAAGIADGVAGVFTQLGVLPFDENQLPQEDPLTP
jgi:hypothetical protein